MLFSIENARRLLMCYHLSIAVKREYLETQFDAMFLDPDSFEPMFHVSAFSTPYIPILCNEDTKHIQLFQWGLIPFWAKDEKKADEIRFHTFNARAESVFEKPSYRSSIKNKRCLVLVDGFYEWREVSGKKYPYYIRLADKKAFALAGIWDRWVNKATEEVRNTFSIITTRANALLEKIHNIKKRMPVVLRRADERRWIREGLETDEINSMLNPSDEKDMEAYPISKLITARGKNTNVPEVSKRFEYKDVDLSI